MTPGRKGGAHASLLRIGEAAKAAGVSTRTLRYYEELKLLVPSDRSAGGARRYDDADIARLRRIRELQELLGFDLGEIGDVLRAEDHLADLRRQYEGADGMARRRAIVDEAIAVNARLRSVVRAKQGRLDEMMRALESKARLYRSRARELAAEPAVPVDSASGSS